MVAAIFSVVGLFVLSVGEVTGKDNLLCLSFINIPAALLRQLILFAERVYSVNCYILWLTLWHI